MIATPGSGGRVNVKRASGTITYPGHTESTTNVVLGVPAKAVMVSTGTGFSGTTSWVMPGDVADGGWGLSTDGKTLSYNIDTSGVGKSFNYTYIAWY